MSILSLGKHPSTMLPAILSQNAKSPREDYPPAGFATSLYSELVSPSDLPAVSGAMEIDSTNPKITRPAATSMVGPMPNAAMKIGVPYVATIVPTREMPMANPTAVALTSVGNSSLG